MTTINEILTQVLNRHPARVPVQPVVSDFLGNKSAVSLLAVTFKKESYNQWVPTIIVGPKVAVCDESELAAALSHELSHLSLGHMTKRQCKIIDYFSYQIRWPYSIPFLKVYAYILDARSLKNEFAADRLTSEIFGPAPLATGILKCSIINRLIDSCYKILPFCSTQPCTFLGYAERFQELANYLNDNPEHLLSLCREIKNQKNGKKHPTTNARIQQLGLRWDECVESIVSTGFNLHDPKLLFDGIVYPERRQLS
jgi:hypothetical protein